MQLANVKPGDILRCDVRGDRFYALASGPTVDRKVPIESLTGRPIPAMYVTARQIVGHWRKAKGSSV